MGAKDFSEKEGRTAAKLGLMEQKATTVQGVGGLAVETSLNEAVDRPRMNVALSRNEAVVAPALRRTRPRMTLDEGVGGLAAETIQNEAVDRPRMNVNVNVKVALSKVALSRDRAVSAPALVSTSASEKGADDLAGRVPLPGDREASIQSSYGASRGSSRGD